MCKHTGVGLRFQGWVVEKSETPKLRYSATKATPRTRSNKLQHATLLDQGNHKLFDCCEKLKSFVGGAVAFGMPRKAVGMLAETAASSLRTTSEKLQNDS